MPKGVPSRGGRVIDEFKRRSEPVRVVVTLDRGQLEDLETIVRYRRPKANRSEVVREAIRWLLAREALQIVRGSGIEARKAERAAREAEAIQYSRQEREQRDQEHEIENALAIAQGEGASGPAPQPKAADTSTAALLEEMRARIDALEGRADVSAR